MFLAFGEVDLLADAHAEPSANPRSDDIELMILRRSAHMQNFAPSRALLVGPADPLSGQALVD